MWTCKCGEQIEDQFDACWKCTENVVDAADPLDTEEAKLPPLECQRCNTALEYLGKKRFHEGGYLTPVLLGDLGVHRENFDLFVCSRCGHVEFFLEGVAKDYSRNNVLESDLTST